VPLTPLSPPDVALLLGSGLAAGAINAVAGGGSFVTFPALLLAGVGPIEASATSTVAIWPGSVASALGYARELREDPRTFGVLGLISLIGGVAGALLLVRTPPGLFLQVLPFLLLAATLLFTFGDRLRRRLESMTGRPPGLFTVALLQLPVAIYGGYFGGGMGLMMLAFFALMGMKDIHRMNGLKSLLAVAINGSAVVTFVLAGTVDWYAAAAMTVGAIAGGFGGASLARRLPPAKVRLGVTIFGWCLTAYFFVRSYAL
jgi:uncharacterized membrane protein YfcA